MSSFLGGGEPKPAEEGNKSVALSKAKMRLEQLEGKTTEEASISLTQFNPNILYLSFHYWHERSALQSVAWQRR